MLLVATLHNAKLKLVVLVAAIAIVRYPEMLAQSQHLVALRRVQDNVHLKLLPLVLKIQIAKRQVIARFAP